VLAGLAIMSAAGAAWSGALIIALVAGARPLPLWLASLVAATLVAPGFVAAVATTAVAGQGRRQLLPRVPLWAGLPHWARLLSGGLFLGFWLSVMTAFMGIGGNAEIRDGQYVLNNHGSISVVDRATYERELSHEQRIALGVLGGFGVGAASMLAGNIASTPWRARLG
jgi:hypothetical protein